ncbi:hypothetical protein [Niabella hibiscisoli]|uniref:hypothetical protein n=1 Tax=Niabella hibiscisoli TaxID=1825928 RepID=UPI001F0E54F0|nr:hypothetical protein [Niabella hibiscisoli]MCH5717765.1 hypothetical protein [Niabella hibiscisoli]
MILSKKIRLAAIGAGLSGIAVLLGAFGMEGRSVEKTSWHIGLDWLLLDLLLMAVIFVPLELFFPKRNKQARFHEEWRTDLVYFAISHLFIQFFGVVTQKPAMLFFGWIGLDKIHAWVADLPFILGLLLAFLQRTCSNIGPIVFFIIMCIYGVFIRCIILHKIWTG